MRFLKKHTNWSSLALLSILPLVPQTAKGVELEPTRVQASNAEAAAQNAADYCKALTGPTRQPCESCAQDLQAAVNGLKQNVDKILESYIATTAAGTTSVAQQGSKATAIGSQHTQTTGAGGATGTGSQSNAARAKLASNAEKLFGDCVEKASNSSCNGAPNSAAAGEVKQFCTAGQQKSSEVAQANSKAGSSLGEMASALGQAAQALGPLMQQMMQGQGAGAGSSDPYGSSVSKPAPLASAKLSSSSPAAGGSVGFGSGSSTGVNGTNSASGYAPAYQARSFEAEPLGSSLSGSDSASLGSSGGGGTVSSSGASTMGGGGFGSKDSSGASKMAEAGNGILDPNNFEMPAGGSSGGRPFLGLKSKSAGLEDSSGGVDTSSSFSSELGLDDEGRDLASTDQLGSDIHGEESGTLFDAIRSKYSEIKKRGNI